MIETTIYNQLKTLGYTVSPIGPMSEDRAPAGSVDGPIILYRRKSTDLSRDLAGDIVLDETQIEILVTADTSQQAQSIASEINYLLDNETFDGFTLFLNNQFVNDTNLTVIHLWYSVLNEP